MLKFEARISPITIALKPDWYPLIETNLQTIPFPMS